MNLEEALNSAARELGYERLRKEQKGVVEAFVGGHDVFAALPTGYGKSLCFALLPRLFDILRNNSEPSSIVLCISPLVSLMEDQKARFSPRGLVTEFVGGVRNENTTTYQTVIDGKCQLIYMTPESLFGNPTWWKMLQSSVYQANLVAVVVDEAHCVQKW